MEQEKSDQAYVTIKEARAAAQQWLTLQPEIEAARKLKKQASEAVRRAMDKTEASDATLRRFGFQQGPRLFLMNELAVLVTVDSPRVINVDAV